ncbi:putative glucose-1-phosphate adenylyltransferase [Helianthus annuus]|nr:putative glucose-1-phosphate adenylyltransferase [Helianthus annuus]
MGTVDAVRHYLWLLEEQNVLEFLVLAGDHLYRMDYEKFIQAHRVSDANITFAALPMDEKRATSFGLMKIDEEGRIIEFSEKPKGEKLQATKKCRLLQVWEYNVFSKNVMLDLMREKFPKANDFGSEVIPGATSIGLRVSIGAYLMYFPIFLMIYHNLGDIGTIEAFYHANLGITKSQYQISGQLVIQLTINLSNRQHNIQKIHNHRSAVSMIALLQYIPNRDTYHLQRC